MSLILLALIGVVVFLVWHHHHWQAQAWPEGSLRVPRFQAHRGYHEVEVENTLAAFRAARVRGAEMFELDVRLTKDLVPVIFHDVDLQRIANRPDRLSELTLHELQKICAAPSLREVLDDEASPRLVNIELKTSAAFDGRLEAAVAQVVREAGAKSRVLFSSFNPLCVYRLAKLLPDVPRALLATGEEEPQNKKYLKKMWFAPYVKAHLLHLDQRYVSDEALQNYVQRGIPVAFWTVNDPRRAAELLAAGALSIISDHFMSASDLNGLAGSVGSGTPNANDREYP